MLLYRVKRRLLTIFGDIRLFRWPMFVVYQPDGYRVKGPETRAVMDLLRPGDVLLRAYDDYLDGRFIPGGDSRCSHSGVYIGHGEVVHAIAEGCVCDDVIDFCRCDRVVVLRPDAGQAWAVDHAYKCAEASIPYDFDFQPGPGTYYCHEFTASCYPGLGIAMVSRTALGFIRSPRVYLADSFYDNPHFTRIHPPVRSRLRPPSRMSPAAG